MPCILFDPKVFCLQGVLDNSRIFAILHKLKSKEACIANVRGNSFKTIKRWVSERLSDEEHELFTARMQPDIATTHTEAEARLWYPLKHLTAIYEHIVAEMGQGDEKILEDLGSFMAEIDLGGVLKPLVAFVSIPGALRRTPYLWPRYDDSGEFRIVSIDEKSKHAELELADYGGGPLHCVVIRSWLKRGCELIGGKEVTVSEIKCRWRDGGTACHWKLTWR